MTATPAVIGLSAGNRLLTTSFGPSDLAPPDAQYPPLQFAPAAAPKLTVVVAHRASSSSSSSSVGHARAHAVRALRNHSAPALAPPPPPAPAADPVSAAAEFESSLEAIVLLQRSMLEKQWELPFDMDDMMGFFADDDDGDIVVEEDDEERTRRRQSSVVVARSGVSARQRRMSGRRRVGRKGSAVSVSPELMQTRRSRIYLRGTVSKELLTHKQVVQLSKKIKDGIWLQHQRSK